MTEQTDTSRGPEGQTCSSGGSSEIAHRLQDKMIETSLERIKHKLLVMSGKGGVGKSSIAANLAVALADAGERVGLMDVDLHGPSIPQILGLSGQLETKGKVAVPKPYSEKLGVVSIASLMPEGDDSATIWRGPLKIGVIRQFIADVKWDDLDFMVIDSPPGTGDEPLTVAQTIPDAYAIIVTTPQEVSLADVRRSINFCKQVDMKILGLIENMGPFACPHCGKEIALFKSGGGKRTADAMSVPFLGSIPFDPQMVVACDAGTPIVEQKGSTPISEAFEDVIKNIKNRVL
ncbi:MAG: ATPase [Desulfobacterales bacterium C00003104]|nr:MAG: ATPase [Desulfobacterales bacterium C00003104]